MNKAKKIKKKLLIVISLSFLLLLLIYLRTDKIIYSHPFFVEPWDHHKYIEMARHPFTFHIAPFCWRILVPLIAFILPFELQTNFMLITFFSIWFTAIVIYYLLKQLKFDYKLSFLGVIIYFSLGWVIKYVLFDFWLVDALSFLFIVLIIYSIVIKNDFLFILFSMLGILTKETILFAIPLYYSINAKHLWDKQIFKKFIILSLPSIIIFFLIRFLIKIENHNISYLNTLPDQLRFVFNNNSDYTFKNLNFNIFTIQIIKDIAGTFGILLLVFPFLNIKENIHLALRYLPFILLSFLQLLNPNNIPRLLIICFPVFLIMSIKGIQKYFISNKTSQIYFFILVIIFYNLNLINPSLPNINFRYQFLVFSMITLVFLIYNYLSIKNENSIIRKI